MSSKTTQFGFKWDEHGIRVVVQRTFCDERHMCITIATDKGLQDIWITRSGHIGIPPMKKPRASGAKPRVDKNYLKKIMEQ